MSPKETFDASAANAASFKDEAYPVANREDILRELGRQLAASRSENTRGSSSGPKAKAKESAYWASACKAAKVSEEGTESLLRWVAWTTAC